MPTYTEDAVREFAVGASFVFTRARAAALMPAPSSFLGRRRCFFVACRPSVSSALPRPLATAHSVWPSARRPPRRSQRACALWCEPGPATLSVEILRTT